MTIIICTPNLKGGVGKTTTAVNCAAAQARDGRRVLLIDGDGDCCATDATVGTSPGGLTFLDVLREPAKGLATAIIPYTRVPLKGCLHVIRGSEQISDAPAEFAGTQMRQPVASFHKVLPWLIEHHAQDYDYVWLDPGPNWDPITDALVFAAQWAVVPVAPEPLAVKGVVRLLKRIQRNNRERREAGILGATGILGLLISKVYPDQQAIADGLAHEIDGTMLGGAPLRRFSAAIPYTPEVWQATGECLPVWSYAPDNAASRAFGVISAEIERFAHVAC